MTDELEMTEAELDADIDEYLSVALAMGATTGFSKGTANVSPRDLKKLRPLIKFYSKKPHPFRACVKDNRKRFGALTEKYCAVLKDLIVGNTKWRNQGKKKNLSEQTLAELYQIHVPDGFFAFLSELSDEEVAELMVDEVEAPESTELAEGDVAWDSSGSWNDIRRKIEDALNGTDSQNYYEGEDVSYGMKFWVTDVNPTSALVCEGGSHYYVVGWSIDKKGVVTVQDESEWKPVAQAWVEEKVGLSQSDLMAEMFFAAPADATEGKVEGDHVWKTIMREGVWAYSPGRTGAAPKPIKVVAEGASDKDKLIISMAELKSNFEKGAVEHVTIPTSHEDKVLDNTGFIRKLRIGQDDQGRKILEAAMDFTEPDVKQKALRGTIANTSAGVQFDYIQKESGTKFRSVLAHAALTNRPWLNGMKPFGVNASDDLEVIGFSEEPIDPAHAGGGEGMTDVAFDFSELGFENADELKAALSEAKELKAAARERNIADLCQKWQDDGKAPALVAEAQTIMMSDSGSAVLNLSEGGKEVALSATDIVKRIVDKSASVKLDQEPVTEKQASEGAGSPAEENDDETKLSQDEQALAAGYFYDDGLSWEKAVEKAKAASGGES